MQQNSHYGVSRKRQFCCECKRPTDSYRSFEFGSGKIHVCDACWPASSWNQGGCSDSCPTGEWHEHRP